MPKFLILHLDNTRQRDVAEVKADNALEALNMVQGYQDTLLCIAAIEFEGAPPKVYDSKGQRTGATEGDALEPAAEA